MSNINIIINNARIDSIIINHYKNNYEIKAYIGLYSNENKIAERIFSTNKYTGVYSFGINSDLFHDIESIFDNLKLLLVNNETITTSCEMK